jgi:AcrR family transcriptional regulator
MTSSAPLSDAETRRETILAAASAVFARTGYAATPVTEVAKAAGISQAYVFKLFPTKRDLFVAVVEHCYKRIVEAMNAAADTAGSGKSDKILAAMGDAYERLIVDRDVLMLQVHAQAATDVPEIREAVRHGTAGIIATVKGRSGAGKKKVQRFIAHCQLCHLVTTLGLLDSEETWARILKTGLGHPKK